MVESPYSFELEWSQPELLELVLVLGTLVELVVVAPDIIEVETDTELDVELDLEEVEEEEVNEELEELESDEEIIGGRHVPSPFGRPLSHLQLKEQPSPLTILPSSHSSPSSGFHFPSPQAAGVAPRLMMYGKPIEVSPKV